jgi:hypothetical protein
LLVNRHKRSLLIRWSVPPNGGGLLYKSSGELMEVLMHRVWSSGRAAWTNLTHVRSPLFGNLHPGHWMAQFSTNE